jgi:hypothetical protein
VKITCHFINSLLKITMTNLLLVVKSHLSRLRYAYISSSSK